MKAWFIIGSLTAALCVVAIIFLLVGYQHEPTFPMQLPNMEPYDG